MERKHQNTAELTGTVKYIENARITDNGTKIQGLKIEVPRAEGKKSPQRVVVTIFGQQAEEAGEFKVGDRVTVTGKTRDDNWKSSDEQKNNRIRVDVSENQEGHFIADASSGGDAQKVTLKGVVKFVAPNLDEIKWNKDGEEKKADKLFFVTACQAYDNEGNPRQHDGEPLLFGVACEVIGKRAEKLHSELKEGDEIDVTGEIQNSGWKDGDVGRAKGCIDVDEAEIVNPGEAEESKAA